MEQLSLLPKVYEYGESLSSEEMNQIVLHLNSSIEAINYLLAKNNGINDGHCEMRYKVSAQLPEAPAAGSDGKSNGWSDTYTKPDTDNGEITWMTLCFLNGNGIYGAWSNPVCITWGSIEGLRGRQGEAGIKGSFKSRVFKRLNTRPDTPTGGTYDNPLPTSEGWTDGIPQGSAIIWSSVCTFHGDGTSSGWSTPAPESDSATLDVEFSPLTNQPLAPIGNTPFTNHEFEGWYDPNSVNFESAGIMIWRAERKVSNGEYDGDWTITRIYGEKGEKGDSGSAGGHHEFRYRNYIPSEQYPTPSKPATGSNGTTHGWSESQQPLSETDIKNGSATWMTQCYVNEDGEYGEWTPPIRITGANGRDGEDGTIIEFVYTLKDSVWDNPIPPLTTQVDDWHGTGPDGTVWTDNPLGVDITYMYEYISQRSKINDVWTPYSNPVIWSKWGEKGMDGDGVLYIYKLFSTELTIQQCIDNIPDKPDSPNLYGEWIPSGSGKNAGWNDDPVSPNASQQYCYCSVIKKINGTWGNFEKLSLWSRYSKDSDIPGPDGKGITYIVTRDNYSESDWSNYCAIGHSESFGRNASDQGNSCRVNDFFIVKGTAADGTYKFHLAIFRCTSFDSSTIAGTCVSHVKDGEKGSTGATGPMFYIAGIWDSNKEYTKNEYKCPVVMLSSNNKYYYLKNSSSRGQNPSSSSAWGEADNFAAVFTHVLFSEFAKLGSFVINLDWMISLHGVEYDSGGGLTMVTGDNTTNYLNFRTSNPTTNLSGLVNFCPNLAIDAKTGKVYAQRMEIGGSSVFKGMVYALGGSFTGAVNATELTAGNSTGMNIRTTQDRIEFRQGDDVRAYFVSDGNGMQLHIWDAGGDEHIINFSNWSSMNSANYTNETWLSSTGNANNPFNSVTLCRASGTTTYLTLPNTGASLVSGSYYKCENVKSVYDSNHNVSSNKFPAIFAYYSATINGITRPYAIDLNVNRYREYIFTDGVPSPTDNYIYHSSNYPNAIFFDGYDVQTIHTRNTFLNPKSASSAEFHFRYSSARGTESILTPRGGESYYYVESINQATKYSTFPEVYEI